ncbi:MAG: DUF4402 domain-containing protein [Sphingopyxis sp.]|nr:DUF4402 domain-containing protein [Sphingopyxis sp.]
MGPAHHIIRRRTRLAALFTGALAIFGPASTAIAAEEDAASRARILRPITLTVGQDLSFGTILPSTTRNSTVRINLNDTATPGGGALVFGATHGASRTSGQGTLNQIVVITRPTTVWLTGPGPRMRARSWSLGTTSGLRRIAANQYRIIGAGGNFTFRMGATLAVARNQPEGEYQGSFTVTVNYQ